MEKPFISLTKEGITELPLNQEQAHHIFRYCTLGIHPPGLDSRSRFLLRRCEAFAGGGLSVTATRSVE